MLLKRKKIIGLAILYGASLAGAGVATWISNGSPATVSLYLVGQILGSVALTGLVGQLLMSSRLPFLEKGVGQDRLLYWHRYNAAVMSVLIAIHPAFFLFSLGFETFSNFFSLWAYWVGVAALGAIVFVMVTSIFSKKLQIDYELWRLLHLSGYLIIILALLHSVYLGSNMGAGSPLFLWWMGLAALTALAMVWRFLVRPLRLRGKWYRIDRVERETDDVVSLYLKPEDNKRLNYAPGQFAYVIFESKKVPEEEHHFTLSSAPSDEQLQFTVKSLGDFTSKLQEIETGAKARIEGPFGVFSNAGMNGPFVFLAAGIGITPVRAMLKEMETKGFEDQATLIYANRTPEEAVFMGELRKLDKAYKNFKLITVYSEDKEAGDHYGRIDSKTLRAEVDLSKENTFFIVGPKAFNRSLSDILIEFGVKKEDIFTERFELKEWGE